MIENTSFDNVTSDLKILNVDLSRDLIVTLLITKYLSELQKLKLIEGETELSDSGNQIVAICQKHGFVATKEELIQHINDLVSTDNADALLDWLHEYQINPSAFILK